jgi:elongation factor G
MGADFYADVASIQNRLSPDAIPIQLPIGAEADFKGIIDLFNMKARIYEDEMGKVIKEQDIPEDYKAKAEEYRAKLVEKIAENDEELLDKYLAGEEIDVQTLKKSLRKSVISRKIFPILCGSALNKGVQLMLDAIVEYLPSPVDIGAVKAHNSKNTEEIIERKPSDDEAFTALAFKIATDPFVGKLAFFRVYSGSIATGSYVLNPRTGDKERVGRIVRLHANHREEVKEVFAGDIAALVGPKEVRTGDTLCDSDNPVLLEPPTFAEPVISMAIEPKTKADQEKLGIVLQKLLEEDPTLHVKSDEETGQTVISGMGELHLEIVVDRMKREFKVEANVGKPQVAYKETVTKNAEAEGKYIRQTGGRGQYGHVFVRIEPKERGTGNEFVDEIVGGVIPKEFIPAVQKGITEAESSGVLAGFPVVDVKVTLYDGSYHDVDSSEVAFKIAGSIAFKDAFKKASPILLEPIMKVEVVTPEANMGDVMGDLNSKRGQILGMGERGNVKTIDALVPLAEMFGYATQLRSMTQGQASYSMEFDHYAEVPKNIAEKIAGEAAKKE